MLQIEPGREKTCHLTTTRRRQANWPVLYQLDCVSVRKVMLSTLRDEMQDDLVPLVMAHCLRPSSLPEYLITRLLEPFILLASQGLR